MSALPIVVVNPASRGGEGARDWPKAASTLRSELGAFECRFTERRGHATEIAREEAAAGRALLVSFGGDGTISEVARGILESGRPAELGILPHGTGSDLVRSLSIPNRLRDAARLLRSGRSVRIDVGRAIFADGREKSFLNSSSFGLSADVAARINRSNRDDGGESYLSATARAASAFEFPEVEMTIEDDATRRTAITTVSLHNGRYFGGGMKMAPEAVLTDGRLDLVVVHKLSVAKLLKKSPLLYLGAHLGLPEVEHGKVTRLDARPAQPDQRIAVEVDGETGFSLPARFELREKALLVRLPGHATIQR